jgi:hypothetical protein
VSCDTAGRTHAPLSARLDFKDFPDGPAPSDFGPTQANLSFSPDSDTAARFRVEAARLIFTPTQPGRVVSYYSTGDLGGPVINMGAKWSFSSIGGTSSALVLLVTKRYLRPPYSIHLVITPVMWSIAVWPPEDEPNDRITLYRENFAVPLDTNGDLHQIQVVISGDRAEIVLPNGGRKFVRDNRIAEWAGSIAVFGAYTDDGATADRVALSEAWASAD